MFPLESPHQGDSNENTQYTIFNKNTKTITINCPKYNVCSYGIFSWGLKNEFEIAVVNESLVFEPLQFYCNNNKIVTVFTSNHINSTRQ